MVEQYPLVPAWRCALAYLYRELDMPDAARAPFEHFAADDFVTIRRDANWRVGVSILASVAATLDDAERSARLYELLRPYAHTTITAGMPAEVLGSVHQPLMALAARWAAGTTPPPTTRRRSPPTSAWAAAGGSSTPATGWAAMLTKHGYRDQARAHAAACLEAAAASGMPRVAERASALLDG